MARNRYLIAYDIQDDKRLRRVINLMKGTGTRLQYSLFLCDLSQRELILWEQSILQIMSTDADSVIYIDLGKITNDVVHVLGAPRSFPRSGPQIL